MKKENTIQLVGGFVLACIVVGVFVTEEQVLRLKQSLADEVLDHKIDVEFLKIACQRAGTSVEDLKRMVECSTRAA